MRAAFVAEVHEMQHEADEQTEDFALDVLVFSDLNSVRNARVIRPYAIGD